MLLLQNKDKISIVLCNCISSIGCDNFTDRRHHCPQFTSRSKQWDYKNIDMWLRQHNCNNLDNSNDDFGCIFKISCPARLLKFNAAAAISIISIILCFVTFILCVVQFFVNISFRIIIIAFNALSIITILIIWSLISGMYNNKDKHKKNIHNNIVSFDVCNKLHSENYKYTTGWIL